MGLTNKSTGTRVLETELKIEKSSPNDRVIALAGNPNVGKSTVFNCLTGLNQHTGNWPGKTVANAQGKYIHRHQHFILVDIPGTYSLMANSVEEEVARDFICFGNPDATIVVVDATCLERNLNLVLQTLEITSKVIVCVNLMDEAKRKKIHINLERLQTELGVPVIGTSANKGNGLNELMDAVYDTSFKETALKPLALHYDEVIEKAISEIQSSIELSLSCEINTRWMALKLLEGDQTLIDAMGRYFNFNLSEHDELIREIKKARDFLNTHGIDLDGFRDKIVSHLVNTAEQLSRNVVSFTNDHYNARDRKIDKYLTSKKFGIPIMILLLGIIFWLTITGSNIPSEIIASGLFWFEDRLTQCFTYLGTPSWVHGLLVLGIYRTLAWVVSVMLPPMAIFFPLFTLLEDLGYLPRIAFNLDNFFKKSCACGKQALTMCMGFGCNAAGITGCRIIDSPRERLIAIITNNFVPCNGRFPILIAIITMFFTGMLAEPVNSIVSTLILTAIIIFGVFMTLFISKILSKTILKGIPSTFTLELPPYRKPQIGKIIIRSIFDRTLFVLGRAICVAAPAGCVIWLMANIKFYDISILSHCAFFIDPFAKAIGLDGYILIAFILGLPANEIVIPIIIMSYMSTGSIMEFDSLQQLRTLLISHGWTPVTALCVMLFTLMHWPCGTTCWTIKKETASLKWTVISFLVPTLAGIIICFLVANTAHILGL
ncbi:MAG: ferrous iron transport protein [Clostridia bacterium]|jgi:ferrous iron transport protein B|nr:ferrous iron transport protein [Clostridia bacterium]